MKCEVYPSVNAKMDFLKYLTIVLPFLGSQVVAGSAKS